MLFILGIVFLFFFFICIYIFLSFSPVFSPRLFFIRQTKGGYAGTLGRRPGEADDGYR